MKHDVRWSAGTHDALATRRVRWGAGALGALNADLDELAFRRAFILTTRSIEHSLGDRVRSLLGERCVGTFPRLPAHVPSSAVDEALVAIRGARPDVLVCVGGGSVLDAAKAITVALADSDVPMRTVAIPTTLAGSEYAHFYGVTEDGFKRSYASKLAVPELVVLDPVATETTPRALWNGSAFKAIDHAVETVRDRDVRPIADPLALLGITEMVSEIERSNVPGAGDARLQCQIAAWHCYFSPANAVHGLSHRLGHVLGGTYGVPHSATSSITLPAVLRATRGIDPGTDARIDAAVTPAAWPDGSRPAAADALVALAKRLGLPTTLSEVAVTGCELSKVGRLVSSAYPEAVADLGPDSEMRLHELLESVAG